MGNMLKHNYYTNCYLYRTFRDHADSLFSQNELLNKLPESDTSLVRFLFVVPTI